MKTEFFHSPACIPLLLAITWLVMSCSKTNTAVPVVRTTLVDWKVIEQTVHDFGIVPWNGFAMGDGHYGIPEEKWVLNDYLDLLRNFQAMIKQTKYISENNDCDDFAKMAAAFAKLVYSNTAQKESSIAVGEFYYKKDGLEGNHAINFAIVTGSDGKLKLIFIDPMTWSQVFLSPAEVESCANWIL